MKFLGIYREPAYSPGRHLSNDAVILRLVGQALERYGAPMQLATLEEARSLWKTADLIFSMCQGPDALAELAEWKKQGALILNDPEASRRTYRDSLCSTLREKDLGFPHSEFLSTEHPGDLSRYQTLMTPGAWLKRADVHATQAGDVVKVQSLDELAKSVKTFVSRGLKQAVLQQHRPGDEVKFYAVRGGRLFWPYYPKESKGHPFDEHTLESLAEHAAKALDIGIYGGDAIISPEGDITLIDLNDWPSFAPCRGAAASAIAKYLKETYHALQNSRTTAGLR
ncbi:MAG: hypothetical protein WC859_04565 [Elusimicrobiota bacterium]|jgi:glutathione synthase/RimK-type ligase-like ATP-grasp enzyme